MKLDTKSTVDLSLRAAMLAKTVLGLIGMHDPWAIDLQFNEIIHNLKTIEENYVGLRKKGKTNV